MAAALHRFLLGLCTAQGDLLGFAAAILVKLARATWAWRTRIRHNQTSLISSVSKGCNRADIRYAPV